MDPSERVVALAKVIRAKARTIDRELGAMRRLCRELENAATDTLEEGDRNGNKAAEDHAHAHAHVA